MIGIAELRRSARAALAYAHSQPEVEEAEAFVAANGQMLCRLNYTSHIPCNGVEEPKSSESFGIGIRAVFKTSEGRKIGFGSETADITLTGAQEALAKARQGAVLDPEFESLPRPAGEARTLGRYHDPRLMRLADGALVTMGWQVVSGALRAYRSAEELAGEDLAALGLILGGDVTVLQERIAIASTAMPRVQSDESAMVMAYITSMVERGEAKGSGLSVATRLAGFGDEAGRRAARNAIAALGGVRVRDGEYRVVLGPQAVADIVDNLLLPSLSLGTFYAAASPFLGKLGQPVAWEGLSVYDDGARLGLVGSKGITCEGLPTGRTELIRDGVLVGLLANDYESRRIAKDPKGREKLGAEPREWAAALAPRNGFRFARGGGRQFDAPPGIAGTNLFVAGREGLGREELLRAVGDGLYIGRIWYTYPVNGLLAGDFTCTVVGDSYVIREGRLAEPLRANAIRLNDNLRRLLNQVIAVGREAQPALVWAADQVVYAPEVAVAGVPVQAIAEYMQAL